MSQVNNAAPQTENDPTVSVRGLKNYLMGQGTRGVPISCLTGLLAENPQATISDAVRALQREEARHVTNSTMKKVFKYCDMEPTESIGSAAHEIETLHQAASAQVKVIESLNAQISRMKNETTNAQQQVAYLNQQNSQLTLRNQELTRQVELLQAQLPTNPSHNNTVSSIPTTNPAPTPAAPIPPQARAQSPQAPQVQPMQVQPISQHQPETNAQIQPPSAPQVRQQSAPTPK